MLKTVILTSDLFQTKELINHCIGKISALQIIGIFESETELELFRKESYFDIILFYNFEHQDYIFFNGEIISINTLKTNIKKEENKINISNKLSFEKMRIHIEKFLKNTITNSIRQKTTEILIDLGFSFKHIGTKYIADAICYATTNNYDCSFENLEKDIYPYLAKVNHTQIDNVKWSVARTINLMYLHHTTKSILKLEEYFCLEHLQKPTPKLVMSVITNRLLSD